MIRGKNVYIKNKEPYFNRTPELRMMVFASLFAALTAVGAYIQIPIPFSPVPVTLQVFFVLLAGSMLKSKWGGLSMIVYTLLGIAGLPVFAGGSSGIGVLLGPTGGYITGFILAAYVIGKLSEKAEKADKSGLFINALNMSAGVLILYACGFIQLMFVADIGPGAALALGVIPFLPGEIIKTGVAAYIASNYKL
ncbi:Substrate-specific component BioY of biotin ECF transporter [Methanosarcina barkeri str. Wiesmoor]|uniref:Substrate-specific component BioY of biotin ECF transporter n=2 Tax=Methanosarcina barkeri TaxID=2208 RepID=A0A0E3QGI0_METBA|nr:Substrate-specific component BioY of biotin ECF transporter [Methanosarcina barkeri str. Wiesmoor]